MATNRAAYHNFSFESGPPEEVVNDFYSGMRQFWHPVSWASDLPDGESVGIELLGTRLVLARLNGTATVLRDVCRHMQTPLSLGEVAEIDGKQCIQCPYHGWAYNEEGRCVRIPQLPPDRKIPRSIVIPSFLTQEKFGIIWVTLSEEPRFDVPDFPEWEDDNFRAVNLSETELTLSSSNRMIMGTLDDTHFPWVHEGILATRDKPEPPDHEVWREDQYLVTQFQIRQPKNETTADMSETGEDSDGLVDITYTDYVGMPNVIRLIKDNVDGRYVIWLATCPISYNQTQNFWIFARNFALDPKHDQEYEELSALVRAQDKPILEGQRPWLIPPLSSGIELPTTPADLPLIEYIKWLEELGVTARV